MSLSKACEDGDLKKIQEILKFSPELINVRRGFGNTLLMTICSYGHLEIARFLLEQKPEFIDERNNHGWTPLMIACLFNRPETVRFLLEQKPELINERDIFGNTSLIYACATNDHLEIVRFLLDEGADVTIENENGQKASDIAKSEEIRSIVVEAEECASLQKHP